MLRLVLFCDLFRSSVSYADIPQRVSWRAWWRCSWSAGLRGTFTRCLLTYLLTYSLAACRVLSQLDRWISLSSPTLSDHREPVTTGTPETTGTIRDHRDHYETTGNTLRSPGSARDCRDHRDCPQDAAPGPLRDQHNYPTTNGRHPRITGTIPRPPGPPSNHQDQTPGPQWDHPKTIGTTTRSLGPPRDHLDPRITTTTLRPRDHPKTTGTTPRPREPPQDYLDDSATTRTTQQPPGPNLRTTMGSPAPPRDYNDPRRPPIPRRVLSQLAGRISLQVRRPAAQGVCRQLRRCQPVPLLLAERQL